MALQSFEMSGMTYQMRVLYTMRNESSETLLGEPQVNLKSG
jgi:hypothetical protein